MHGQVPKVQEHLIRGQLLLDDIIPVDGDNGHTDEQVEVVRLRGTWRTQRGPAKSESASGHLGLGLCSQVPALGIYTAPSSSTSPESSTSVGSSIRGCWDLLMDDSRATP